MKRTPSLQAALFCSALSIFSFTQCTDDKALETVETAAAAEEATPADDEAVVSLTIDGLHTVLASTSDCKTCDYVVPRDASVVDGKKIGIKPGQSICLDAAIKYGNISIINVEGEAENPITIAYGVKTISTGQE